MDTICYEKRDGISRIVLNRPGRRNAINAQMVAELAAALDDVDRDSQARVLVLSGAGPAFCAGADLKDDEGQYHLLGEADPEAVRQHTRHNIQRVTLGLQQLDIPTIASVNGPAMGGGLDWALACDLRIGSERATFRLGTGVGVAHGTGGTWLLPRVVGLPRALEMFFTGRIVGAEEAERIGLLNKLVAAAVVESETWDLADQIARGPALQIRLHKLQIYKGLNIDLATALELAAAALPLSLASAEFKEGLAAFREKRPPDFRKT